MTTNGIAVETPLIYSHKLSTLASRDVYLKLENVQPSGSFKLRGLSHSCIQKSKNGCKKFVGSSGGNAGLALAYSALKLDVPCQLYVPTFVNPRMLKRIKDLKANVTVISRETGDPQRISGDTWAEANEKALEECRENKEATFIHPYDDSLLWDAYSEIILKTKEDLKNVKPSCIVVSVGGGGLLLGLLRGLERADWMDVPILAMETEGADCFNESVKAGRIIEKRPTSIAKTLGATSVAPTLIDWLPKYNILSQVLPDKDAVEACVRFSDDHGFLVEPSCGISLAAVYKNLLPNLLDNRGHDSSGPIVIIVCGGSDITPDLLSEYIRDYKLELDLDANLELLKSNGSTST